MLCISQRTVFKYTFIVYAYFKKKPTKLSSGFYNRYTPANNLNILFLLS